MAFQVFKHLGIHLFNLCNVAARHQGEVFWGFNLAHIGNDAAEIINAFPRTIKLRVILNHHFTPIPTKLRAGIATRSFVLAAGAVNQNSTSKSSRKRRR